MRTLTILVPDDLAERLEAEAAAAHRDLAEMAGERFATALRPIDPRVLATLPLTPDTKLLDGRLVYVRPAEPPDWVKNLQPQNPPTDGTNGMHRVYGALETPESDAEMVRLLQEES